MCLFHHIWHSLIVRDGHTCVNIARRVQAKICLTLKSVRENKQHLSERSISCDCCPPASLHLMDCHCDGAQWTTEMVELVHISVRNLVLHSLWNWGSGAPRVMLWDNTGSIRTTRQTHTQADIHVWWCRLQDETDTRPQGISTKHLQQLAPPFSTAP